MKKLIGLLISVITIYILFLYSYISNAATHETSGELSLEILPGVDAIYAPILVDHGTFQISPNQQQSEYLWNDVGPNLEFIEFDIGSGSVDFDIAVSVDQNFSGQTTSNFFDAETVEIKGCKQNGYCSADNYPDKLFGTEVPNNCAIFLPIKDTTYTQIDSNGITLIDDGIGGIGSNCIALNAKWRFVPATRITIPPNTIPDIYNTNITFTLTTR